MRLIDREAEKQALHEVLDSVRRGMSGALVLRGEPGAGKSVLLGYAVEHAGDLQIVRTVAVESEKTLGFAGVHQLLSPLLPGTDRLPEPQRRALGVAFGLVSGAPADPFLVGLAALTLLADAAEERPVLCVVDDAQWLDDESADVLTFVARRLLADRVAMLFALRDAAKPDPRLQALPGLRIAGLPVQDACELLQRSISQPVNAAVAERIVVETGGNPLAVVEAARELAPEQLGGLEPLPQPLPLGKRLEDLFVRRVQGLPADTQRLVLLAAADQPGRGDRLWRAATALGIQEPAAVPAEAAGLVVFWPEVRFFHPLVRSAVYHTATAVERRQVHRALAAACDPELDAVPRAWHLAEASARPDEEVAAALEAAADQAGSRGGCAAAAALLERAALLTRDKERRAERHLCAAQAHLVAGTVDRADALLVEATRDLRDPLSIAQTTWLKGRVRFHRGQVASAASALAGAARQLRMLDPPAARDALLSALEATVFAGWAPNAPLLHQISHTAGELPPRGQISHTAGELPPRGDPPDSATSLLLQGCALRVTGGYGAAVPALQRAIQAFLADDVDPDVALRRLELVAISAVDMLDDAAVEQLATDWIDLARQRGALARLADGFAFRSAFVDAPGGRLGAAQAAEAEARELAEVTGNPGLVPPSGAHTLLTLALSGQEAEARAIAAAVAREAPGRGAAGELAMAAYFLGVLEISLGNYDSALGCLGAAYTDDTPLVGTQALPDLVEAAVRAGRRDLAERALGRLADRATATGTPLALGLLARSRALLAAPAGARQEYEDALQLLARTRTAPALARAHLLYGEWLRRQRRRREARDQLRTALEMFDAMGLRGFAGRTRVELGATGERARRREVGILEELTPQEAQIAALVSRGHANREIAAQLFVSPNTVEYHLRKVFRKLGVSSRTQLAHHVLNQGIGVTRLSPAVEPPAHAANR